jgi:hypothetical protein
MSVRLFGWTHEEFCGLGFESFRLVLTDSGHSVVIASGKLHLLKMSSSG